MPCGNRDIPDDAANDVDEEDARPRKKTSVRHEGLIVGRREDSCRSANDVVITIIDQAHRGKVFEGLIALMWCGGQMLHCRPLSIPSMGLIACSPLRPVRPRLLLRFL